MLIFSPYVWYVLLIFRFKNLEIPSSYCFYFNTLDWYIKSLTGRAGRKKIRNREVVLDEIWIQSSHLKCLYFMDIILTSVYSYLPNSLTYLCTFYLPKYTEFWEEITLILYFFIVTKILSFWNDFYHLFKIFEILKIIRIKFAMYCSH